MLTHLFQQSLRDHTIPAIWKQAYITPIYKKGNRLDPKNYRPVSLTSLICKTMKHILVSHIMKHLESNDILTEVQHGFRSKHSCEAPFFLTTNDLAKAIDNNTQVDMVILDFSKAFDEVAHNRLKHKLDFYGIRGNLFGWLESFFGSRTQQIVIGGTYSPCSAVTSGFLRTQSLALYCFCYILMISLATYTVSYVYLLTTV